MMFIIACVTTNLSACYLSLGWPLRKRSVIILAEVSLHAMWLMIGPSSAELFTKRVSAYSLACLCMHVNVCMCAYMYMYVYLCVFRCIHLYSVGTRRVNIRLSYELHVFRIYVCLI